MRRVFARKTMRRFTSLRARLVGTVFVALVPAWVVMYLFAYDPPWIRLGAGALALGAAWFGGEMFIMRQVRAILEATKLLASGDLTVRTGLEREPGELGDLARSIDQMAAALQRKDRKQEDARDDLNQQVMRQAVVSALGQFALQSKDFLALMHQAVIMVSQTLQVEYVSIFELDAEADMLSLRASVGWLPETAMNFQVPLARGSLLSYALSRGEPILVKDLLDDPRFEPEKFFHEHGARSAVVVAIQAEEGLFGLLLAHTGNASEFKESQVQFMLGIATVLAMAVVRRGTEAEMEKLATFTRLNPAPALELSESGLVTYSNDAANRLAASFGGCSPAELLPLDCMAIVEGCLSSGEPLLDRQVLLNGRTLSWSFHPVLASGTVHVYIEELTHRLNLEAQLRQSQKMESIGQLAAGVAHDFNNMLTIIQGHSGLLLVKPDLAEEHRDSVQAVYFAAERAAALTRQLLMFSRKNVMQPKQLDIAEVITTTSKLLERLLGESIRLVMDCDPDLQAVRGDSGMIEQVIVNLAVNARDAMSRGGTLTISANAAQIGADYVQSHPDAREGNFIRLSVQDTGAGIDAATLPHIFEPFFTTKEVGKGTGLGLATVYGIIKQHDGWIDVQSEVGRGTVFSVFFPSWARTGSFARAEPTAAPGMRQGKETILLVEDEFVLRELARAILKDCGYTVIDAPSGREGLKVWQKEKDKIDLVLTDMMMPDGVSGMDLASEVVRSRPGVKIIFASGYSMDELDPEFLRKGHGHFLQKPYTHVTLSKAVRECLDNQS